MSGLRIAGLDEECDEPFLKNGPDTVIPMDPSKPYPWYATSTNGNGGPWVNMGSLRQREGAPMLFVLEDDKDVRRRVRSG